MQTINESLEHIQEDDENVAETPLKENTIPYSIQSQHSIVRSDVLKELPVIDETEELGSVTKQTELSKSSSSSSICSKKSKKRSSKVQKIEVESVVITALKEWLTIESYIFLFGEKKIKEIFDEKKLSEYFDKLNIAELKREQQMKYMEICKRLHLQEMADEKFDNALLGDTKLKPVPDYQKLKAQNKELSIKVKCFYSGVLQEREDRNFPTKDKDKENSEGEPSPVLPLVDITSQTALRRKIFLASINKS